MTFGLSKEMDEVFYLQFTVLFLISFFINTHADGRATLFFIEKEYGNYLNQNNSFSENLYLDDKQRFLKEYSQKIIINNKRINWTILILYWIVSPLINYFYLVKYLYNKAKDKVLNTSLISIS